MKVVLILTIFFSLDTSAAIRNYSPQSKTKPNIRVRVGQDMPNVFISGTDISRRIHLNHDTKSFEGRKAIKFNCINLTKRNRKWNKPVLLASLASPTGLVSLSDEKFHGKLHVVASSKKEGCDVVNETPLDSYISSLLSKEMNASWPIEALKAQAVAARTYAIHMINSQQVSRRNGHEAHYDLESSEKHQVGGDFFDATSRTIKASYDTEGYVLKTKDGGKITPTFFHAKCGGKTLLPRQVWDNKVKGYKSVPCPFCHDHGKRSWNKFISYERIRSFLDWSVKKKYLTRGFKNSDMENIRIFPDKLFKDKLRVYVGDQVRHVSKTLFRKYFGRFLIPSNNFKVSQGENGLVFDGRGLGHGVGMCQLGALDLAKKGWSYKKILAHYFPNHKLEKIY